MHLLHPKSSISYVLGLLNELSFFNEIDAMGDGDQEDDIQLRDALMLSLLYKVVILSFGMYMYCKNIYFCKTKFLWLLPY